MASLPSEAIKEFTPEEVKALYPSDLTLQYVQIFFRHGIPTKMLLLIVPQANGHRHDSVLRPLAFLHYGTYVELRTNFGEQYSFHEEISTLSTTDGKSKAQSPPADSRMSVKRGNDIGISKSFHPLI
jgi:hypothetical protein